jgi:hypothetical protein
MIPMVESVNLRDAYFARVLSDQTNIPNPDCQASFRTPFVGECCLYVCVERPFRAAFRKSAFPSELQLDKQSKSFVRKLSAIIKSPTCIASRP